MKPSRRHHSNNSEPQFPKSKTPTADESGKKVLQDLDVKHLRLVAHNAVMWSNTNGVVLNRRNDPFAKSLAMEYYSNDVDVGFEFFTSTGGNGYLSLFVWYKKNLVLALTDAPGVSYNYPSEEIKITTYAPGAWEKFLLDKGYKK